MTYEVALMSCNMTCFKCNLMGETCDKENCATEWKRRAVEKQVPKKPLTQQNDKEIYMYCPNCDMPFESSRIKKIKMNFCFNCGQRLEWGEDE